MVARLLGEVDRAATTHTGKETAAFSGRLDPRQLFHAGTVDFNDRDRVARLLEVAEHAVARHGTGDRVADQQPPLGQVQFGDDRRQLLDNAGAGDDHPRQDHRARRARFHGGAASGVFNSDVLAKPIRASGRADATA